MQRLLGPDFRLCAMRRPPDMPMLASFFETTFPNFCWEPEKIRYSFICHSLAVLEFRPDQRNP